METTQLPGKYINISCSRSDIWAVCGEQAADAYGRDGLSSLGGKVEEKYEHICLFCTWFLLLILFFGHFCPFQLDLLSFKITFSFSSSTFDLKFTDITQ